MSLLTFIQTKMRMSHIYQPVMIKALVLAGGRATREEIAKKILEYDFSQVEYYEKVVDNMVGKVLRRHNIIFKNKKRYSLLGYEDLSEQEKEEIIRLCNEKIDEYIQKRGKAIFEHRSRSRKPVSGSVRYEVLKRALGRCELCGISKDEKALEVDHIVPKNHGGEDSLNNYQALCYTCNANKRDTDDTDFRNINEQYAVRKNDCVFCNDLKTRMLAENNLAIAVYDKFPVTDGHVLVIPKRHCDEYFDLNQAEINAVTELLHMTKQISLDSDDTIKGFNVGMNNGIVAGQTIFHCHIHLIPRRAGDVQNPRGGVRHIIPGMGNY